MIEDKLLKMKKKIENATSEKNRIDGQMEEVKNRLVDLCGTYNGPEIQEKISQMENDIKGIKDNLISEYTELESNYDWD